MTVKSLRKQLAAAIAMTLVATVALGSSTYAWFAQNGKVTATGMDVQTVVKNNLFIANSNASAAASEDQFFTTLQQEQGGFLEPVSTTDGKNFYYAKTDNVIGTGNVKEEKWETYSTEAKDAFNVNYGTTDQDASGYVDYVYQLKAVTGDSNPNIYLTKLDLKYGGDSDANGNGDANKAFRVAIFAKNLNDATQNEQLLAIYTPENATNFAGTKAIAIASEATEPSRQPVEYNKNNWTLPTYKTSDTSADYKKGTVYLITVRLWLEGEDTTCNNTTFANLSDKWRLDMEWELKGDTDLANVSNIGTSDRGTESKVDMKNASASGDAFSIAGTNYYKLDVDFATGVDTYTLQTGAVTSDSRIFTYKDGVITEVTNECELPVASNNP